MKSTWAARERPFTTPRGLGALASEPAQTLTVQDGVVTLDEGLALRMGGRIAPCRIAYRLIGAEAAPIVAVMGGISADRRVCAGPGTDEPPGWWEEVVGPAKGLDLNRWRVLAFDFLAGPGGSSAPGGSSGTASSRAPHRSTYPR